MTAFRLAFHEITGRRIVEVWEGDQLIAAIYPAARAVKIVSKFPMMATIEDSVKPAALLIDIGDRVEQ